MTARIISFYLFCRLTSRLQSDKSSEVEVNFLYNTFKFESAETGSALPVPGLRLMIDTLKSVFPDVERVRRREGKKWLTLYRGISIKPLEPLNRSPNNSFQNIHKYIPRTYNVIHNESQTKVICSTSSGCISNGNNVLKQITFNDNGTWELQVYGKNVTHSCLQIENKYTLDQPGVCNICSFVSKLKICEGMACKKTVQMSRFHIIENFQNMSSTSGVRTIRSLSCNGVLSFAAQSNICKSCRIMTFTSHDKENLSALPKESSDEADKNIESIKHLLKHANQELVNLFLEQSENVSRDPRGRRWSQSFLTTCLQLYNRSPCSYELLLSSNILVLPSPSTLILYKNKIKQEPGFDQSMFQWMLQEANRTGMPEDGMLGAVIFDEMAIQSDLQISKKGEIVELVGFTDLGNEGDLCHTLRKGSSEQKLGTYILQLLFLGLSGFRFPFAHFVTDGIQASELYGIFWKAVQYLWTYGFKVVYTCMDGAVCNRSFMHICVGENSHLQYNFVSANPTTSQSVIFTMDVSHVLKKIRNNIMKSGLSPKCTRNLMLQNGHFIQWQMFADTFKWDQENALQLHQKLTNEHIFPDSQQKMRNHLADEVLNTEMLHLMRQYKIYLGEKGQVLDGAIEFLENTSKIVSIFRDMRPITVLNDSRLQTIQEVSKWFLAWERFGHENKGKSTGKNKTADPLMSPQCHEDIQACLQGFILICQSVLKNQSNLNVIPGLVNSDIIENVFNQQRSSYNGPNTNPNALQYRNTINSIVIGQMLCRESPTLEGLQQLCHSMWKPKSEFSKNNSQCQTMGV